MALSFKPQSEDELKRGILLEDGDYDFEVLAAEDAVSAKGNPMIKLKLGVWNPAGKQQWVFDYILEAFPSKLRHFCDSVGLRARYEAGTLSSHDCQGRSGRCRIVIVQDKEGKYEDKNQVDDYLLRPARAIQAAGKQAEGEDDIPF